MTSDNNKEIKKRINEDWLTAFPQLGEFRKNRFYKIAGPLLFGVDLMTLTGGGSYRPYFVCYSLWGNSIDESKVGPEMLIQFTNRKGLQPTVAYNKHSEIFSDIAECVQLQMPIRIDGDVHLKELLELIAAYSKKPPLSAAPTSYLQAALREFKLGLLLLVGSKEEMQKELDEIRKVKWDEAHFSLCNIKVEEWLGRLANVGKRRDEFLANIDANLQGKAIAKLKRSQIVP